MWSPGIIILTLRWIKFLTVSRIDLQVFQICKHLGHTVKKDGENDVAEIDRILTREESFIVINTLFFLNKQ